MSEYFSLGIVFVILYVIECVHFVSPRSLLLRSNGFNRCSVKTASDQFLVAGKSIALTTLFAPWGQNYFLVSEGSIEAIQSTVNESQIREQWESFLRRTYFLRALCTFLFFLLLLLLLQAIYPVLPTDMLFAILVLLVASLAAISICSFLLMRSLFPKNRATRWATAIKCLLYPPAAVRVLDLISGMLFQNEYPIEVAASIGRIDDLAPIVARHIRELCYPITSEQTESSVACAERLTRLESLASQFQIPIETFLLPKESDSREGTQYCPRCLQVYDNESVQCADCPGVTKVTL